MAKYTIEREIHFYRIDCGNKPSGQPKSFDPKPVFEYVNTLGFKDGSNYWNDNGKFLGCWVKSTDNPCKVIFANLRRTDLPLVEDRGEHSQLELSDTASLSEQTHIVFFEDNIVGCDINFYAPGISRLSHYLSTKAVGHAPEYLSFNPILRRDVYQQLEKFEHIKMLKIKVRAPYIDTIAKANESLGASLRAARRAGGDDDLNIELTLKSTRESKELLSENLFQSVKILSRNPEIQYAIETFKVSGYNTNSHKTVELDLLSGKLFVKRDISKLAPKSKGLISSEAFKAVISAYEEVKDEIRQSPSLIL